MIHRQLYWIIKASSFSSMRPLRFCVNSPYYTYNTCLDRVSGGKKWWDVPGRHDIRVVQWREVYLLSTRDQTKLPCWFTEEVDLGLMALFHLNNNRQYYGYLYFILINKKRQVNRTYAVTYCLLATTSLTVVAVLLRQQTWGSRRLYY